MPAAGQSSLISEQSPSASEVSTPRPAVADRSRIGDAVAVPAVRLTTSDVDQASAVMGEHFYPNHLETLSPCPLAAAFDIFPAGPLTFGDLRFATEVRITFGELGASHVDVPLAGELASRQGAGDPMLADPSTAGVFQPVGDTALEEWRGGGRLLAVEIARGALEDELARMLDGPVAAPLRLEPQLDLSRGAGASWARLARLLAADAAEEQGLVRHP